MGNKGSCTKDTTQGGGNRHAVTPHIADPDAFYNKRLLVQDEHYYENDKYSWLVKEWDKAIISYKGASGDFKNALNQNMKILIDDHNFRLVRRYISKQMTNELCPVNFTYIFKLARVMEDNGNIMRNAAVVVTMRMDINKATIADSYTGKVVKHENLINSKEYCCDAAEVWSFKVVGEKEEVMTVTPKILDSTYKIVSNFDVGFEYKIAHHITEPNFGNRGTGCYQGIHFFINEDAALRYTQKGMIDKIRALPYVTKSIMPEESDERTVTHGLCYLEEGGTKNMTVKISNSAEALLRYYNSMHNVESYRGLKQVCRHMYGDWYLRNNFGVNTGDYNIEIETIPDDPPPPYNPDGGYQIRIESI